MEKIRSNIKILVACHKADPNIREDEIYMPIQVGKELHPELNLGFQCDNTGENISEKNGSYCELTALYWAWKNLKDVEYIGLCHYRRYFDFKTTGSRPVINKNQDHKDAIDNKLCVDAINNYDVILAKQNVYQFDLTSEYERDHFLKDLLALEQIIFTNTPEYTNAYKKVMYGGNKLSPYNMFIMSYSLFCEYCEWIFNILKSLEEKLDISGYDDYQSRIYGFLGERMLNVFVEKIKQQKELKILYRPVIFISKDRGECYIKYVFKRIVKNILYFLSKNRKNCLSKSNYSRGSFG